MLTGADLVQAREDFVRQMVDAALESSEDYIRNFYGIDARPGSEITVNLQMKALAEQ